ncbi:MAG: DUF624 domain-containing protein [Eubacteriales bacterium]|nr:DUF624 domain-containing protein [Eubacteriales bacterium]
MDNKFFVFMGRVADLIILNLLCLICCIPIVTAGASITAMYYVTLKMARDEESYIVRSFFKSFKENFKQATIINVIMLATAVMLFLDLNIVNNMEGTMYKVLFCIFIAFTFLYALLFLYIYPVLSKFYNTVKNTFVNAFLMAIRHLPYTFLMLVISLIPVAILFIPSFQVQSILIMLFILMGFATVAYFNSKFLVKIFDNYVPKEEDDSDKDALPDSGDTPV